MISENVLCRQFQPADQSGVPAPHPDVTLRLLPYKKCSRDAAPAVFTNRSPIVRGNVHKLRKCATQGKEAGSETDCGL
jgi:hypothetical protein